MENKLKQKIINLENNEFTEYLIYQKISKLVKDKSQSEVLSQIAQEELKHCDIFKSITKVEPKPKHLKLIFYVLTARLLGLTFALRLMESQEGLAQSTYEKVSQIDSRIEEIIKDENKHENALIDLINEDRLKYVSSIVLGLNDALVELTGALVGFTLALQNTRLIAIVGLITGIAASMSMAASEYLSTKQEKTDKNPLRASIYTGFAYVLTVLFLVFPYFLLENVVLCLLLVIFNALLVIVIFTFYISVAKQLSFRKRFLEMASISLTIAGINFVIGLGIRKFFGIDI